MSFLFLRRRAQISRLIFARSSIKGCGFQDTPFSSLVPQISAYAERTKERARHKMSPRSEINLTKNDAVSWAISMREVT